MAKSKLSDNHRRSLSGSMYLVEKLIDELEREINYKTELRMLNRVNDIPVEREEEYKTLIVHIKKYVAYMADKYSLKPNELVQSRINNARKVKMWEVLCDSKSKSLKGYGKFPEEFSKEYDSDIVELLRLIEKI